MGVYRKEVKTKNNDQIKYRVYRVGKKGQPPVKVLDYEPTDFLIGELAVEFGPIEIVPEIVEKEKTAEEKQAAKTQETETYIQSVLPAGVKTNWNKEDDNKTI